MIQITAMIGKGITRFHRLWPLCGQYSFCFCIFTLLAFYYSSIITHHLSCALTWLIIWKVLSIASSSLYFKRVMQYYYSAHLNETKFSKHILFFLEIHIALCIIGLFMLPKCVEKNNNTGIGSNVLIKSYHSSMIFLRFDLFYFLCFKCKINWL